MKLKDGPSVSRPRNSVALMEATPAYQSSFSFLSAMNEPFLMNHTIRLENNLKSRISQVL